MSELYELLKNNLDDTGLPVMNKNLHLFPKIIIINHVKT